MRKLRQFLSQAAGVTAIEFAIIFPVYLLMIFGTVELGYVLWAKSSMYYAASYGSRFAFINPKASASDIQNNALSHVYLTGNAIDFNVTKASSSIDINGSFTYNFLVLPLNPVTATTTVHQDIPTNK